MHMDKTKKFKIYLFSLVGFFILGYGSLIVVMFLPISLELKLSYALIVILVVFVVSVLIRPKIYVLSIASHFSKLKESQNSLIKTKYEVPGLSWENNLYQLNFKSFGVFDNLSSFYQILFGEDIIMKRGLLTILNVIKEESLSFHDGTITSMVHDIEDYLVRNKNKYTHYLIINIKFTDELTSEQIDLADQVAFEKHKNHHVSIINVYVVKNEKEVYFLHNDQHFPSIVYKNGVDLIKKMF
jgi:hypothetical protein